MPKRKAVSLAGGPRAAARHQDATPERLSKARRDGAAEIDGAGVRRIADAFDMLRNRNLLDRLDIAANETLWFAGDRLRSHWHRARIGGVSSVDLLRPSVDGGGSPEGPGEACQRHRDEWRRAVAAIGPRLMPYVAGIVIEGRPVSVVSALVTDSRHPRTAEALALDRLREGLHRLCDLWRMRPEARPLPIAGWRTAREDAVSEGKAGG
jgi:hypothetical protein